MVGNKGSRASKPKTRLINIEDVLAPFCGKRPERMVPLRDSEPELALEWCYARNCGWGPEDLSRGSRVCAWWTCATCGHTYRMRISERALTGRICLACRKKAFRENATFAERSETGRIILSSKTKKIDRRYHYHEDKDYIPLSKSHPHLAKQWHPVKNGEFKASDFSAHSGTLAWWNCKKGSDHEWQVAISSRTDPRAETSCPFCSNKRACSTNSLQTKFPDLAQEWHPKRNGKLTPKDVVAGSGKKVWWQCKNNSKHQWQALVVSRSGANQGCPDCGRKRLSDVNRLSKCYPKIAAQLHPTKNGNLKASQLTIASTTPVWWKCPKGEDHEWRTTTHYRVSADTGCPACNGRKASVTNSLATLYPEVAKLWDRKKNGKLRPTDVASTSKKSVWWLCKNGHSWTGKINMRTRAKSLCFQCHKAERNGNWLNKDFPHIAAQLHPTKKGGMNGDNISASSKKKVWWVCPEGPDHEWHTTPKSRAKQGSGCPACGCRQISVTNCLAAVNPDTAKLCHPRKNKELTPAMVFPQSKKLVWWLCPSGHSWQQSIKRRVLSPIACWTCVGN